MKRRKLRHESDTANTAYSDPRSSSPNPEQAQRLAAHRPVLSAGRHARTEKVSHAYDSTNGDDDDDDYAGQHTEAVVETLYHGNSTERADIFGSSKSNNGHDNGVAEIYSDAESSGRTSQAHTRTGTHSPLKASMETKDNEIPGRGANGTAEPSARSQHNGIVTHSTPKTSSGKVLLGRYDDTVRNPDRSARRKSARTLIKRTGNDSDEDALDSEQVLAQKIWNAEDGEEDGEVDDEEDDANFKSDSSADQVLAPVPETPSKRGRGRPKGTKRKPTPSPPRNLPAHEHYFFQNRAGGTKTSNNTFSSALLINHEDYFTKINDYKDPHGPELSFLQELHSRSFDQWIYELEEGFNICLYGWGSKRTLIHSFVEHFSDASPDRVIVMVNGYTSGLTVRDVLTTLASTIPSLLPSQKFGVQPTDMLNTILTALNSAPPAEPTLLVVNSLDAVALRRSTAQSVLARLAASPHINVVASTDTPNFPLLWDTSLKSQLNFLFHDATTFQPYHVEMGEAGVVVEVNKLLGRSGRRIDGSEGVMYVLKSLTESARGLYALLLAEILSLDDDGDAKEVDQQEDHGEEFEEAVAGKKPRRTSKNPGIEYRALYQKAVSQFIATSETTFRMLLKEFHDHEMVVSKKDALGTEVLSVPFRKEEMQTILEDLTLGELDI